MYPRKKSPKHIGHEYLGYVKVATLVATPTIPLFLNLGITATLGIVVAAGFLFGTGFYLASRVSKRLRMKSFALQVLAKALLTTTVNAVCSATIIVSEISVFSGYGLNNPLLWTTVSRAIRLDTALVILGIGLVLAILITGWSALNKKLGPGVFWNWVTGKYYLPREEELVFMFLDMKDSTAIAERLGNLKFSALIREAFSDLTPALEETGARVSHYIGDEAVIYWSIEMAMKNANCLRLLRLLDQSIADRSSLYQERYGLIPEFKAGLHMGLVVATEVGDVKSEVVFHGDVLNTTARIQELCGELGERFLVSSDVVSRLGGQGEFDLISLGQKELKGKSAAVEIYAVHY